MQEGEVAGPRHRLAGHAWALTLALALSGCGSGGGGGPASDPVPPQPTGLTAEAGDGEVLLSWTAIAAATRWEYRQRIGDGAWSGWTTVAGSGSGTTEHTVADLENGEAYGFQVRAVSAGGAGPASAEATATPVAPGVPVEIPDGNLRRVLELALGKESGETITDVDLRTLSELRAEGRGIVDLTGLEHATALESVYLAVRPRFVEGVENEIADIGPLASLALLTRLELQGNRVSDLEPLSSLGSLEYLELSNNAVSDISPLAGLASLTYLGLSNNDVADLQPVSGLASLTRLDLNANRVRDLTPLSALASLENLDLTRNRVADISPLAGLTSLQELGLAINRIVDVRPLADLTSLTVLHLSRNPVVDISALRGIVSLEELTMGQNPVSDVEPLSALTSLRRLYLAHVRAVENLSFVSGMEELEDLHLAGTSVSDLGPLASLSKLEELYLGGTAVDDLSPLAHLKSLQYLGIHRLSVDLRPLAELTSLKRITQLDWPTGDPSPKVDIAPLAGLTNLRVLAASPMYGDLSPLADLASLVWLRLREPGTPFENLQTLEGLTELYELEMGHGGLVDISPLAELTAMRELELGNNRIEDLEPLGGLESLQVLDLRDNRVRDIDALAANPGLGMGDTITLVGNPLGADALRTHIPELESRGAAVAYDRDDFPDSPLRVLHDEAVSMRVDADLDTVVRDLNLVAYTKEFLAHFGDGFDVLLFASALPFLSDHANPVYAGVYYRVSDDVGGIGLDPLEEPSYGSTRLKGVIHFPYLRALAHGPSLHELMHMWANYGVPTSDDAHWGFSSADGQLGGFALDDLVDLGGGRWSAGSFATNANGGNSVPYSPWELYLGGFVGPEEVPDLWVAGEGRWTGERTEAGHAIFEAAEHSTLTVDEFVEMHGPRDPDHASAPKELRGAVIVLEDDDRQLHHWDELLEQVRWLSHPGRDAAFPGLYNYHEATGGRGRLVLDGLLELRRETPLARVPVLRLVQACPSPGAPSSINAASLTAPWADGPSPADFGKGWDLRPGERTED